MKSVLKSSFHKFDPPVFDLRFFFATARLTEKNSIFGWDVEGQIQDLCHRWGITMDNDPCL